MSFFERKAKHTTIDTGIEAAARAVEMTATEIRYRREEVARMAGSATGDGRTKYTMFPSGAPVTSTSISTASPGITGPWVSTTGSSAWTMAVSPVSPQRETFNVYRCEVYDGLLLRINGDSYIKLGEVGEPNPAIHIVSSDLVTLVGNLLDWAMEALHE